MKPISSESEARRLGLLERGQRLLVVALPALDLRDAQIGLRVLRIGGGDGLKVLERRAELVIVQQRLGQTPLRVQVIRLHVERLAVSVDGVLVVLELVVAHAQRVVHFGGAVVLRHGVQHLDRVRHVAGIAVQPRQVQHYIF